MMLPWIICPKATRTNQKPIRQISPWPTPPCHTFCCIPVLASTATGACCGAYPYHARCRDLPRRSQRISNSAMLRKSQPKSIPQKKWKPAQLAARNGARSPEVRKRSLEWNELIHMGNFSPMSANFVTDTRQRISSSLRDIFATEKSSCE